ncbi:MAG: GtrA family protein [Paucibacter sp.]|nr:GtrA family protein [Roseateles sp.]
MKNTIGQLIRYGAVGLGSNLVGYLLYIGLTQLGIGPKTAMSILYVAGVAQTFLFNKKWTFRNSGSNGPALLRYCLSYGLGYIINLLVLVLTVDHWGWPHQWVQGAMIFILALLLFTLQKFWVFRKSVELTN